MPLPTHAAPTADLWFSLQGQRMAVPRKGLYIRNGRKVIVR